MMRASSAGARRGLLLAALCPFLLLPACGGDDDESDQGSESEADDGDTDAGEADAGEADAGEADAGEADAGVDPPSLECDPFQAGDEDLCACAAAIVCDQIHFCLDAEELADKPEGWTPRDSCVDEVVEDCLEDLGDDDYLPVDFPQCVQDVADASCDDFGTFDSVSNDFPPSCENFRALDTGLGLAI
jgi:hypothetical protein